MSSRSALAGAFVAGLALIAPAAAQAGCNLKTIDVPLTVEGPRAFVTAKLNGQPVKLILDSGAFYNVLSSGYVADHKLRPAGAPVLGSRFKEAAHTITTGVGGRLQGTDIVIAPSFEFVGAKFSNIPFMALPTLSEESDGLLGQNFLRQLDNDYDLKNGMLKLVQTQDCADTPLVYWATAGMTYSVADLDRMPARLPEDTSATILINGVKMKATFDTGSPTSFITQRAAARAGVKVTDAAVKSAGTVSGIDRANMKAWVAPFASVKIGDEEIKNGLLKIGQSDAQDFDVLIGADFFLAHHVYVANSQGKMYFTYSGGPVFNVQADDGETASAAK